MLSPSIVSSQGGVDQTEQIILEWTLGESFVETVTSPGKIYTQGFHQSFLEPGDIVVIDPKPDLPFDIYIYPNPVTSWLNIAVLSSQVNQININLYDLDLRILHHTVLYPIDDVARFDLSGLPNGLYLLYISTEDGLHIETFKVIKQ